MQIRKTKGGSERVLTIMVLGILLASVERVVERSLVCWNSSDNILVVVVVVWSLCWSGQIEKTEWAGGRWCFCSGVGPSWERGWRIAYWLDQFSVRSLGIFWPTNPETTTGKRRRCGEVRKNKRLEYWSSEMISQAFPAIKIVMSSAFQKVQYIGVGYLRHRQWKQICSRLLFNISRFMLMQKKSSSINLIHL